MRAREIQLQRFSTSKLRLYCSAQMAPRHIRASCELCADCERLLERAMNPKMA
jgi:magnesium chelatase family protein